MAGTIDDKYITVARLRELLDGLADETEISARTLADTGNLALIYPGTGIRGHIDLLHETVEWHS